MEEQNNTKEQQKIPYLSASKMGKLMELISERSLVSIDPEYFKNYGFGNADAYLAINTLKFLGILDSKNKSTEVLRKFQLKGSSRDGEVQSVLKIAYKKLFDVVSEPQKLSKDDLTNEFMHHYGLSRRIAVSAVPAFLKLCEFSGLLEHGSVLTRTRISNEPDKKQTKTDKKVFQSGIHGNIINDYTNIPIANGKMEWRLPSKILTKMAFGGEIADDIKDVTKKLSEFADKYCKEEIK